LKKDESISKARRKRLERTEKKAENVAKLSLELAEDKGKVDEALDKIQALWEKTQADIDAAGD